MKIKGQSALEYLLTYSWAFVILAIVLFIFYEMGLFSSFGLIPTSCTTEMSYYCENPVFLPNGNLSFTLTEYLTPLIYNVFVYVSPENSTFNLNGFPTIVYNCIPSNTYMYSTEPQNFTCTIPTYNGAKIGTLFSGTLWINYTLNPNNPPIHTDKVGYINIKVEWNKRFIYFKILIIMLRWGW